MRIRDSLITMSALIGLCCGAGACQTDSCESHADCEPSEVCRFGDDGTCLERCDDTADCPPGFECDMCATGSCPDCLDCIAACVLIRN